MIEDEDTEVLEKLIEHLIDFEDDITAVKAKEMLRAWVSENLSTTVVQIAHENSHNVIFTPPHYSDLQLIELVCD